MPFLVLHLVHKSPPSTEPQCSVLSCKHQEQNNMRSPNYCSTHTHTHTSQGLIKSPAKSEDLPDWLKPRGKKGENGNYFLLEILSVISRCLKEKKRKKKHHLNPKPNYFPSSYTIHLHRGLRSPHQGQENQNCHHDANR